MSRASRALGVAAALTALATLFGCKTETKAAAAEAAAKDEKKVHVETAEVGERVVPKAVAITGALEADQRTDLAANAAGRVVRTFVERGDHVKAGALLAQLDARAAALTQTEAEANAKSIAEQLASVRADCARFDELLKKGAITQQEYDRQAGQCRTQAASEEAARARAAEASRAVADTSIRAPFSGVIGERYVNVGDYVRADSRVVTLLVDDPLRLKITVPETVIPAAQEGVTVTFSVLSVPDRTFTAVIKYVGREVRAATRDVVDEAIVDNKDHALLPGMFATVELPVGNESQAVVPKRAIVPTDGGPTVFLVVEGRLQQRVIRTGFKIGDLVAVPEGLKKGDKIVLSPAPDLIDGAPVE